ncbi:MAG: bifunctional UDP-3-O-[3-hydroxymyristoyl] N-acetylglucosamine deacetylase/3-hydroxyacyl-ACP dehydratase [Candidatus Kapabacteria bacterium]|jgi:UDP-3-O-[3-hydroxymyristoyl] N-acetylglucosamine deacetylase/3-hydroxyacyl-[acyl-carrier-protein] dehydratase|nr:bifunctional UDP-3-O-[3-hydroxymyristoyl] N-acetylglucosamine deacetylase/3-hydroxyacyl-ACP dehydratase [Candidatus Kapabacteria bacterium]
MLTKQRTIKKSVSYSGIGLHTGKPSTITFHPAPENYGYKFIRTDLDEIIEIPALVENVVDLSRGTTLGIDGVKVHTVEHVLASLVGLQISNCKIELSGKEPPISDGSAIEYVKVLSEAGFEDQEADREYFEINDTIRYTNDEKGVDVVALPMNDFRATVMIDYNNPALGSQHTGIFDFEKEFVSDYAPARTFCFLTEIQMLLEQGLIKGGSIDNAVVIIDTEMTDDQLANMKNSFGLDEKPTLSENGLLNNAQLRFKNEPARHKLLDLLGDLALAGVPIKAQVLAARPGHASNIEFAKLIRAEYLKQKKIDKLNASKNKNVVMDIYDLLKVMPHRYPFLMIDKVAEIDFEKNSIIGIKNVTVNEPFFPGHFPEKPVMPGVMICEALAQTGCLLLLKSIDDFKDKLVFFLSIKNAKFRLPVIPGDQLVMEVKMTGQRFNMYSFTGKAMVNGKVATQIEFQAALVNREDA